jgi:hypothetical protein
MQMNFGPKSSAARSGWDASQHSLHPDINMSKTEQSVEVSHLLKDNSMSQAEGKV